MSGIRALHLHSGNLFGGVETLLVTLARHADLAPQVQWRFALTETGRLSAELQAIGAGVSFIGHVRASRPWTVAAARGQLRVLLPRDAPDVAIVHSLWTLAVFGRTLRAAGLPIVLWLHGPPRGPRWLTMWAARTRPHFVIVNSAFMARDSADYLAGLRHRVLYYPVEPSTITAGATRDPVPAILLAARMEEWKGHGVLLRALARIRDVEWRCRIAGGAQRPSEREYEQGLRRQCDQLGLAERVQFLGQRGDVGELLSRSALYCQPNSGPEPFGISFIEALYAGVPVVTTNIGAAPEIIDASCGVRVSANDPEALAAALRELLTDSARRAALSAAAPARARALCDPAARIPELAGILAEVAAR